MSNERSNAYLINYILGFEDNYNAPNGNDYSDDDYREEASSDYSNNYNAPPSDYSSDYNGGESAGDEYSVAGRVTKN